MDDALVSSPLPVRQPEPRVPHHGSRERDEVGQDEHDLSLEAVGAVVDPELRERRPQIEVELLADHVLALELEDEAHGKVDLAAGGGEPSRGAELGSLEVASTRTSSVVGETRVG